MTPIFIVTFFSTALLVHFVTLLVLDKHSLHGVHEDLVLRDIVFCTTSNEIGGTEEDTIHCDELLAAIIATDTILGKVLFGDSDCEMTLTQGNICNLVSEASLSHNLI